ncbi:peroxiredoxin [Gleimia hominis]|uniref:peroxiredoxin n=1 Tax=Gleimia hominis TaxID=595468 RepID=UPI000C7FB60F|nr:peroxiredoxin [Gleimia hominis]WIK64848.1 peroxiredoxin [Gleimia hominis]
MSKVELTEGQDAPDFKLESTEGTVELSTAVANAQNGVVVYFYPKASTPGCTTEACDFRDSLQSLKSAGFTVIAISSDKMPALEKFKTKQSLNFPLASDPDKRVQTEWGTWGEKKNFGKLIKGPIRSTFVVGKDGKIQYARYGVRAKGHVARLRKDLGID